MATHSSSRTARPQHLPVLESLEDRRVLNSTSLLAEEPPSVRPELHEQPVQTRPVNQAALIRHLVETILVNRQPATVAIEGTDAAANDEAVRGSAQATSAIPPKLVAMRVAQVLANGALDASRLNTVTGVGGDTTSDDPAVTAEVKPGTLAGLVAIATRRILFNRALASNSIDKTVAAGTGVTSIEGSPAVRPVVPVRAGNQFASVVELGRTGTEPGATKVDVAQGQDGDATRTSLLPIPGDEQDREREGTVCMRERELPARFILARLPGEVGSAAAVLHASAGEGRVEGPDPESNDPATETPGQALEAMPLDLAALELGLEQFLHRLDELGTRLVDVRAGMGAASWLLAAGLAGTAFEVARRQYRTASHSLAWLAAESGDPSSWLAGPPEPDA